MKRLRSIHLYLGCVFAPMLLFFAISGIWQTLHLESHSRWLAMLSTMHTGNGLKIGGSLSSSVLRDFVIVMSLAFVVTTVLGVMMALKFARSRKAACGCLVFGIAFPVVVVLAKVLA